MYSDKPTRGKCRLPADRSQDQRDKLGNIFQQSKHSDTLQICHTTLNLENGYDPVDDNYCRELSVFHDFIVVLSTGTVIQNASLEIPNYIRNSV